MFLNAYKWISGVTKKAHDAEIKVPNFKSKYAISFASLSHSKNKNYYKPSDMQYSF